MPAALIIAAILLGALPAPADAMTRPLTMSAAKHAIKRSAQREVPYMQARRVTVRRCRRVNATTIDCWATYHGAVVDGQRWIHASIRYRARLRHGRIHAYTPSFQ